jgi:membrane protease YdiL (CAAX protease family)
MRTAINWKLFLILLTASLISIVCVFPYLLTLQSEALAQIKIPLAAVFLAQLIQSAVLFSILIYLGLFFTKKVQFQLPLLEAIIQKNDYKKILKDILGLSILSGIIAAVIIYALDAIFTMQGVAITTHQNYAPIWQKLLAAVYGGITEEIVTRLFLMTFFIWVSMKLLKQKQPTKIGIIASIFLAAIIFGLGHLPITASLTTLTPLVILRAITLNGIGGIIFGYLFWKKGLESAMLAHFTTDIFLLTLLPLLIKW